jgi:hypothetical protein
MPETVFHIITEDPQVKHVAQEVNPASVHEHGGEDRQEITTGVGKEAVRNEGPLHNKSVTATQLYKEKQDVQSDQGIRDQRHSSASGIIITDWEEHKIYLLLLSGFSPL